MLRIFIGFVLGVVTCSFVFMILIVPGVKDSYRRVGFNDGLIDAKIGIADLVSSELGSDVVHNEPQKIFFDVKATSVMVVERNGVKTLRVFQ